MVIARARCRARAARAPGTAGGSARGSATGTAACTRTSPLWSCWCGTGTGWGTASSSAVSRGWVPARIRAGLRWPALTGRQPSAAWTEAGWRARGARPACCALPRAWAAGSRSACGRCWAGLITSMSPWSPAGCCTPTAPRAPRSRCRRRRGSRPGSRSPPAGAARGGDGAGERRRRARCRAARLELVAGVALLRPDEQVFDAMLAGWASQQAARNLGFATIENRQRAVRAFAAHAGCPPWQWSAQLVDEWCTGLRAVRRPARSTGRDYTESVRLLCGYLTDPAYEVAAECESRFGTHPVQVCHEWNTAV